MTSEEHLRFNTAMKDFYRSCYEREKIENGILWDVLLALINAFGDIDISSEISSYSDKVEHARKTALDWAENLRHYLDERR